jgi:hypothetical protein
LLFWLVYVTPDIGQDGKLIYAYITYALVMILYSANNTPYSALMGVMTPDVSERSSIASYRFVGALIGQFIIQALPLPLVAKLGKGDSTKGWAITMAIFGAIMIILNPITFVTFRRNEVNNRAVTPSAELIATGGAFDAYFADEDRAQRNTVALRDVDYVINAYLSLTDRVGPGETMTKFVEMFQRRIEKGQHFHQPYLGCRECVAQVDPVDGQADPIDDSRDLGG